MDSLSSGTLSGACGQGVFKDAGGTACWYALTALVEAATSISALPRSSGAWSHEVLCEDVVGGVTHGRPRVASYGTPTSSF